MTILLTALAISFGAFCVWLTVRIVNRRERWAKWTAAVVVALPVLYFASLGPFVWLITRDLLPEWSAPIMTIYTVPLNCAAQSEMFRDLYLWYISFWVSNEPHNL